MIDRKPIAMKTKGFKLIFTLILGSTCYTVFGGNEDRAGSAGGTELLINPWARSSALGGSNVSSVSGLESSYINVAGLAYIKRDTALKGINFTSETELNFVRTNWLSSVGIGINSFGISQNLDDYNHIALSLMSMNFGELEITTPESPQGGLGTFSPQITTIGLSYARKFSDRIYGGLSLKVLSQTIANAKAQGISLDAGIKYVTGERDQLKIGITLKNVGPTMKFTGDAFSVNTVIPSTEEFLTTEQRTAKYELPSLVNMGLSYDLDLPVNQVLSFLGSFTSNSFTKDQFRTGVEYSFITNIAAFTARAGYVYQGTNSLYGFKASSITGASAGLSIEFGSIRKGVSIGIDYGYRATNPFNGIHSIGLRVNMK